MRGASCNLALPEIAAIKGTGMMLQPYYVTRLPDQPLYFEGRLVAGMSHDRIQPFGTYTDDFETRRLLLQLKISEYLEYGETTVTPSLAGSYTSDKQLALYRQLREPHSRAECCAGTAGTRPEF
jgi:hypothetical protein